MAIKCKTQALQIDFDKKLWPCCFVAMDHKNSKYLNDLPDDWNDLTLHNIKEILNHPAYTKHFNTEDWESDRCDIICKTDCSE